jgi:calcium uniporter protein, mitochondrial
MITRGASRAFHGIRHELVPSAGALKLLAGSRIAARFTLNHTYRPSLTRSNPSPICHAYRSVSAEATARELSQQSVDEQLQDHAQNNIEELKEKQHERPWHHDGVDTAPVRRQRSAGAMTKGKRPTFAAV